MDVIAVVIFLVISLVVLLQLGMWWRTKRQVGRTAPDITALTGQPLAVNQRALVYFYSQNCGACKPMTPSVNSLKEEHDHVYAVDIGEHTRLARDFGLLATPTVFIVENGQIVQVKLGTLSQKQLERML